MPRPRQSAQEPPFDLEAAKRKALKEWSGLTEFRSPRGDLIWRAQPGMQEDVFRYSHPWPTQGVPFNEQAVCDEILCGGPRGPGKSACAIAWACVPINYSKYVGLILRLSNEAMKETIDKCWELYSKMGAIKRGTPTSFWFPNGAKIYTGYLKDLKSYEQYKGYEYHRIIVDEAQQIPSEELYAKLVSSNRSSVPGLRAQILLTANPDGPGSTWLKKRFVKVTNDNTGEFFEPKTPMWDAQLKRTRIYIPGKLSENKALLQQDPHYASRLADPANSEMTRRAWIEGDWDIVAGTMFPDWRPRRIDSEIGDYPQALHVVPAFDNPGWCHRWLGMDWGYSKDQSAVYWFCIGRDHRIHVEQELVVEHMGSDEMGAEIARRSIKYLENMKEPRLRCYLSPDAFNTRDKTNTIAVNLSLGVQSILGPGSSVLMEFTPNEMLVSKSDPRKAMEMRDRRLEQIEINGQSIWFTMANNSRANGWEVIRRLLRWMPLQQQAVMDPAWAQQILEKKGILAYNAYVERFSAQKAEVLPKMLVHHCCEVLIDTIPKLFSDPAKSGDIVKFKATEKETGDDPADAWRYGCMGYYNFESKVPRNVYIEEEVERIAAMSTQDMDYNMRIMIARQAQLRYDKHNSGSSEVWVGRDAMLLRKGTINL